MEAGEVMVDGLKRAVKWLWARPPVWRGPASMVRPDGVIVLMYHRVGPAPSGLAGLPLEAFRQQIRWLAANCSVIAPEDLCARLAEPGRSRPAVLLTFDDGYRCVHDRVHPVLRERGLPGLVFLATGAIDSGRPLWTDLVELAFRDTALARVRLPWLSPDALELGTPADRAAHSGHARAVLKTLPDEARRQHVESLLDALQVREALGALPREMLSWDEVRATSDVLTFGGHTHTHPIMSRVETSRLAWEIRTCRDRIRDELGVSPRWFAYPNGKACDYDVRCGRLLAECGFAGAFSTEEGINGPDTDCLAIRRLPTMARSVGDFAWMISGPHLRKAV